MWGLWHNAIIITCFWLQEMSSYNLYTLLFVVVYLQPFWTKEINSCYSFWLLLFTKKRRKKKHENMLIFVTFILAVFKPFKTLEPLPCHFNHYFLYINCCKIADIQAHSAAPSAALQACRSAIFWKKSWKCLQAFGYFDPILWMSSKP